MRILLTGTAGQVGGALLPLLQPWATVATPLRQELDLSRPDEIAARLDTLKPDLIVNPAAYTAVDRAEEERELAFRVNAETPAEMAEWAARHHVPLIHFSTDYVFNGSGTEPWREDSATGPLSAYGASKLAGDTAIADSGAPHLIVRTSWVYAASGANFLKTIARLAKERKELRIVADQIGAPTSAKTIADVVANIIPRDRSGMDSVFERRKGVVNVVCAGETSWHGFAAAIVAGLKARGADLLVETINPIRADEFPVKATRPANSRLSLERLRRDFGLETPTWQRALERELDIMMASAG
ncbi:dTDP-4-dehydrorhamnose reductase [Bradyrhizobium sp. CCGUVB1N3]|uniref:dTDP-4-dehydrorhamnose reductase n=1 Tax=Bradyrhizobium sp. CCGUVB1N3 TaxID=2949629 RepID=UPI0020B2FF9A|nr:dTDP-4-dehydrorhamnose reductase [Bradyrhizobium sp. CCGUVB1N3]MCP3472171.1 dTDP-4-dehydrorhamnose reductase [Bradyrhizobium sp. CCGUVB1N3]